MSESSLAVSIANGNAPIDYAMNLLDSSVFTANESFTDCAAENTKGKTTSRPIAQPAAARLPTPLNLTQLINGGHVPLEYAMNLLDSSPFTSPSCGIAHEPNKSKRSGSQSSTHSLAQLITQDNVPLDYAMNLLDSSPFTATGNRILIDTPPATPLDETKTMMDDNASLPSAFPAGSPANTLTLPVPSLKLDFRMSVKLNPKISVGQGPWGQRNWISFTGGQWAATWAKGTVTVCV